MSKFSFLLGSLLIFLSNILIAASAGTTPTPNPGYCPGIHRSTIHVLRAVGNLPGRENAVVRFYPVYEATRDEVIFELVAKTGTFFQTFLDVRLDEALNISNFDIRVYKATDQSPLCTLASKSEWASLIQDANSRFQEEPAINANQPISVVSSYSDFSRFNEFLNDHTQLANSFTYYQPAWAPSYFFIKKATINKYSVPVRTPGSMPDYLAKKMSTMHYYYNPEQPPYDSSYMKQVENMDSDIIPTQSYFVTVPKINGAEVVAACKSPEDVIIGTDTNLAQSITIQCAKLAWNNSANIQMLKYRIIPAYAAKTILKNQNHTSDPKTAYLGFNGLFANSSKIDLLRISTSKNIFDPNSSIAVRSAKCLADEVVVGLLNVNNSVNSSKLNCAKINPGIQVTAFNTIANYSTGKNYFCAQANQSQYNLDAYVLQGFSVANSKITLNCLKVD